MGVMKYQRKKRKREKKRGSTSLLEWGIQTMCTRRESRNKKREMHRSNTLLHDSTQGRRKEETRKGECHQKDSSGGGEGQAPSPLFAKECHDE